MKPLPLKLKIRFTNLLKWDLHQVARGDLHSQIAAGNLFQLAFQAGTAFERLGSGQLNFLTHDPFEVPGFGEPSLNTGRAYFEGVSFTGDSVFPSSSKPSFWEINSQSPCVTPPGLSM